MWIMLHITHPWYTWQTHVCCTWHTCAKHTVLWHTCFVTYLYYNDTPCYTWQTQRYLTCDRDDSKWLWADWPANCATLVAPCIRGGHLADCKHPIAVNSWGRQHPVHLGPLHGHSRGCMTLQLDMVTRTHGRTCGDDGQLGRCWMVTESGLTIFNVYIKYFLFIYSLIKFFLFITIIILLVLLWIIYII